MVEALDHVSLSSATIEPQALDSRDVVACPECGSKKVYNDGHREAYGVTIQRYRCRCGKRFSEPTKQLKTEWTNNLASQQNKLLQEIDLLAALENKENSAGNTQQQQGYIVEYQWKMQKRQLTKNTIYNRSLWLTSLVKLGRTSKTPTQSKPS
jgi:hypothetical protein